MSQESISESQKHRRFSAASIMVGLAAILSIVILSSATTVFAEIVEISYNADTQGCEINELCYSQTGLIIEQGQTVTWKNNGNKAHSIISGNPELGNYGWFNSGMILPDESFSYTFTESGQYFYYCKTHPWMTGIVMVR